MNAKTEQRIEKWLDDKIEECRWYLKQGGIDARTWRHWDPDTDYAEDCMIESMQMDDIWDGYTDYDAVTGSKKFQYTTRIQAAYNMTGG